MTRYIAATTMCALLLAACQGSKGAAAPEPQPTVTTSGTVVLPPGFARSPSTLTLGSAAGTVSLGAAGTFTVAEPVGGGAAMVVLLDASGKVVLLGHVDTSDPSFNDVSATSTAEELLFLAAGATTLPREQWGDVYRVLSAAPETATLAGVIGSAMAVNPTAVADMDDAIATAIDAAVASLLTTSSSGTGRRARAAASRSGGALDVLLTAGPRTTAAASTTGKLSVTTGLSALSPNPGFGSIVAPSNDRTGIVFTNTSRINRYYYVYRTGYVPQGSKPTASATPLPAWELVNSGLLPSVTGLSGVTAAIYDILTQAVWAPVDSPTIPLPIQPTGAVANTYQVVVVGAGDRPIAAPSDPAVAAEVAKAYKEMVEYEAVKEVLWPLLSKIVPARASLDTFKDVGAVLEVTRTFVKIAGNVGLAWEQQIAADPKNTWKYTTSFLRAVIAGGIASPEAKDALYRFACWLNGSTAPMPTVNALNALLGKLLPVMRVADAVLASADVASIGFMIANSNQWDYWDVRAASPTLTLVPPSATFTSTAQLAPFSVTPTGYPSSTLDYLWTGSGYGQFITECGTGYSVRCHGKQVATYTLTGPDLPNVPGDSFTVTAIEPVSGETIGAVSGVVYFSNVAISPSFPFVPPGTHQTFTASLGRGSVPVGANVTWTLSGFGTLDGGQSSVRSTSLRVDYLAPMAPGTDTLFVELADAHGTSLGRGSAPINVQATLVISPNGPVPLNGHEDFTVSGINGFVLPVNATYRWTLSGSGTLSGGNPVTTATPTVTYVAPGTATTDRLQVQVIDAGNVVSQVAVSIPVGILTWRGTSHSVTNGRIPADSEVVVDEYRVDATHVYFVGRSSDTQGYHYIINCGSEGTPGTVTSSAGTDYIAVPSCKFTSVEDSCTATTGAFTLTETESELSFPGATYVWSAACSYATSVEDPFTMTHD